MRFDNGITAEEQKEVDVKYEELMSWVKKVDMQLYRKLRAREYPGFIQDNEPQVNGDGQLEMALHKVTRFYLEEAQKKIK